ncbi:MAG: hypothetical protein ABIG68_04425, partial [Acidobacteriota bacterium]
GEKSVELPVLKRRFLGEAPVEEDGSFNIHVPADVPIELQLLDSDGVALESCAWIWVKNNEPRGCIGCHEDPELAPENRLVQAATKPSVELTLPPERRRATDFVRHVMPIVQSRCLACHGPGGASALLEAPESNTGVHPLYAGLLRSAEPGGEAASGGKYVTPGRARTSRLIWALLGRNISQPWDGTLQAGAVPGVQSHTAGLLSRDEKRVFIEWIDTGAHWDLSLTRGRPTEGTLKGSKSPQ